MTNLTDVINYDPAVAVPDNGEKVIAVSAVSPPPAGEGPIRPALQSLANRAAYLRDRVNKMLAGTLSRYGIVVDGVGAATVTPVQGAVSVSKTGATTTLPATTIDPGVIAKGAVPVAWCGVRVDTGTPIVDPKAGAYNIASISRTAGGFAAGDFEITLNTSLSLICPMVCPSLNYAASQVIARAGSTGTNKIWVYTANTIAGGTLVDAPFMLVVFGEP